jgi:hypothetical protein
MEHFETGPLMQNVVKRYLIAVRDYEHPSPPMSAGVLQPRCNRHSVSGAEFESKIGDSDVSKVVTGALRVRIRRQCRLRYEQPISREWILIIAVAYLDPSVAPRKTLFRRVVGLKP